MNLSFTNRIAQGLWIVKDLPLNVYNHYDKDKPRQVGNHWVKQKLGEKIRKDIWKLFRWGNVSQLVPYSALEVWLTGMEVYTRKLTLILSLNMCLWVPMFRLQIKDMLQIRMCLHLYAGLVYTDVCLTLAWYGDIHCVNKVILISVVQ